MIIPGICSVTLGNKSVSEIIEITKKANLKAIEWSGNMHVPHGSLEAAARVNKLMKQSKLECSSYGSYYKVGVSENEGLPFKHVLSSAQYLEVPTIRVWAGNSDMDKTDTAQINHILAETDRIASMAGYHDISITFEFHGNTLTNSNHSALKLSQMIYHPNVLFSWQQPHGFSLEHCVEGIQSLREKLSTIHVYYWTIGSYDKNLKNSEDYELVWPDDYFVHPLEDGINRWEAYLEAIDQSGKDHYALLEFVKEDRVEQVIEDAATLNSMLEKYDISNLISG